MNTITEARRATGDATLAPTAETVGDLRHQIDIVDEIIMTALVERLSLARQIGDVKQFLRLPLFDAERERDIRARAAQLPHGEYIAAIYRHVLSQGRRLQLAQTEVCDAV
jgi:chorismate mutase